MSQYAYNKLLFFEIICTIIPLPPPKKMKKKREKKNWLFLSRATWCQTSPLNTRPRPLLLLEKETCI